MRIALGIEYDGSAYHGWQIQACAHRKLSTIQGCVQAALSRIADCPVELYCAGRTDAGVHALGQVAHFDTEAERHPDAWVSGTNSYLPPDIVVRWAKSVDSGFHARFSALARCYRYVIYNASVRPAILSRHVTWYYYPLDIAPMQAAAHYFLGEQDFSSFRSTECASRTAMRHVMHLSIKREGECVIIEVEANAFLHHMVRNIVGVLMCIGRGCQRPEWAKAVLAARDRRAAAETAAAAGLYLVRVRYPAVYSFDAKDP